MNINSKSVDSQIIDFLAPHIFGSLKYGENRVCLWFPCIGKTRTINNILQSKSVLKKVLGNTSNRYKFIYYTGTDSVNLKASEILDNIASKFELDDIDQKNNTKLAIQNKCRELIERGKEIVFICDSMESLPKNELEKHLLDMSNIVRINEGRIHTILNFHFYEQIMPIIDKQPSLLTLTNKIEYVPAISGKILEHFILSEAQKYELEISKDKLEKTKKYTGGILTLTRALLRNGGEDSTELDIKFMTIWDHLPPLYKLVFEKSVLKSKIINQNEEFIANLLKKIGILDLGIFKSKFILTRKDDKKALEKILTDTEVNILKFLNKNKNKLVTKDEIAKIIYRNGDGEYSDWAVDQIISRFRKKLIKCNIDSDQLKTIKGKGYIWKH